MFTCETNGDATTWIVNGTALNVLPPGIRKDLMDTSANIPEGTLVNLIIPARAEYNGTTVQCLVVNVGVSSVESEIAKLEIQGSYSLSPEAKHLQ